MNKLRLRKTVNECFENPLHKGIFYYFEDMSVPWRGLNSQLDLIYHFSHSGEKLASKFLLNLCDNETGVLSDENAFSLVNALYQINIYKWRTLWNTLNFDYNPIDSYKIDEITDYRKTNIDTENNSENNSINSTTIKSGNDTNRVNLSNTHTGTDTMQKNGTDTNKHSGADTLGKSGSDTTTIEDTTTKFGSDITTVESEKVDKPENTITDSGRNYNSVYGFNSADTVGRTIDDLGNTRTFAGTITTNNNETDRLTYDSGTEVDGNHTINYNSTDITTYNSSETITYNSGDTTTYNSTISDNGTNTIEYNSKVNIIENNGNMANKNKNGTENFYGSVTRSGNIGNKTIQSLIKEEREIALFNFYEIVFNDIDNIIALKIYK